MAGPSLNLVQTTVLLTALNALDLGICPHCLKPDGVQQYVGTDSRYCSHCEARWIGKRTPDRGTVLGRR